MKRLYSAINKEYEISPIPTNNFVDNIFVIKSALFPNHNISVTPTIGINV